MADDVVSTENEACLAVSLGWRMAELYDREELPGPAASRQDGDPPGHLPGFGVMNDHERACVLAAHVGADLASLGRALGLDSMPTAARVPGVHAP